MKALVTGASGFLGSHLVDDLLASDWRVSALVRGSSDLRWLEGKPIKVHRAELRQEDERLAAAVAGHEVVFHVAGAIRAVRRQEFFKVNVGGTEALVRAIRVARPRPRRLVLVSSAGAQGPSPDAAPLHEGRPPRPITAYGRSKLEAERLARQLAGDTLELAILRPGGIFGPRDLEFLPLFQAAARGWEFRLGWHPGLACVGHVRYVAGAVRLAATVAEAAGQVLLVGGHNLDQAELARQVGRVLGRHKLRTLVLPRPLVRLAGAASSLAGLLSGRPRLFTYDNSRRLVARNWSIDDSRARSLLGLPPPAPLTEQLAETADWYRRQGLL